MDECSTEEVSNPTSLTVSLHILLWPDLYWGIMIFNITLSPVIRPQSQVETPKRETGAVKGRVKLKADASILTDLQSLDTPNSAAGLAGRSGPGAKTPETGGLKSGSASPSNTG